MGVLEREATKATLYVNERRLSTPVHKDTPVYAGGDQLAPAPGFTAAVFVRATKQDAFITRVRLLFVVALISTIDSLPASSASSVSPLHNRFVAPPTSCRCTFNAFIHLVDFYLLGFIFLVYVLLAFIIYVLNGVRLRCLLVRLLATNKRH